MSTFICKSIGINKKQGKVFLTGHSSNVTPATPKRFESEYLSKMLVEDGVGAVEAYLLKQYQGGMMRGGKNDYAATLQIYGEANLENLAKLREVKASGAGSKYVISYGAYYLERITARKASTCVSKVQAQKLNLVDAMLAAKRFDGAEIVAAL